MLIFGQGGRNMSKLSCKRGFAIFAAIVLLAFLMLSPLAELYCEHDHSCCTNECLICLVTNALSGLRIPLRSMICTTAILLFIYACEVMQFGVFITSSSSPVALKTKITS